MIKGISLIELATGKDPLFNVSDAFKKGSTFSHLIVLSEMYWLISFIGNLSALFKEGVFLHIYTFISIPKPIRRCNFRKHRKHMILKSSTHVEINIHQGM